MDDQSEDYSWSESIAIMLIRGKVDSPDLPERLRKELKRYLNILLESKYVVGEGDIAFMAGLAIGRYIGESEKIGKTHLSRREAAKILRSKMKVSPASAKWFLAAQAYDPSKSHEENLKDAIKSGIVKSRNGKPPTVDAYRKGLQREQARKVSKGL